ncbi:MAG TPA: dihydrofolate reductase family protein [Candidatus Saccharimonadia bacterium]|jgi:dihydrofolate reductase
MAKLTYLMLTSLDGYVADKEGNFEWAAPTEEVHAFINNIERDTGILLLGRHMYETLAAWETWPEDGPSSAANEYGKIWRAAKKIVYSSSLSNPATKNTEIEHEFNAEEISRIKSKSDMNIGIGGPHLAAEAIRAGLVDELHQFIAPIIVGSGNYWLPEGVQQKLKLVGLQKFDEGVQVHGKGSSSFVYLNYKFLR